MSSYQTNRKIEIRNLDKMFGDTLILKNISIYLNQGELVSIIGPSGCGKSTIFNIITGITGSDKGDVIIKGNYSYMYQKDLLLPYKNIIDNVSLPLILKGFSKKDARSQVSSYFEIFDLKGYEYSLPSELSGGMRQRANFLRTYICSNDIMLLDEPFGALDSITKRSLQDWFLSVRKKVNSTILLITHDIEEAINLSDRIYVLSTKPATIRKEYNLTPDYINKKDLQKIALLREEIIQLLI